jgi:hypothetical protein
LNTRIRWFVLLFSQSDRQEPYRMTGLDPNRAFDGDASYGWCWPQSAFLLSNVEWSEADVGAEVAIGSF